MLDHATSFPKRSFIVTFLFSLVGHLILGCGASPPTGNASDNSLRKREKELLEVDPIHFLAVRDKERLAIEAYDAAGLFDQAAKHLRKGQCDEAVLMYKRLIVEFAKTDFAAPSLYNSGLCNEQLGRYQQAAGDYRKLIEDYPDSRDITDAMFRLVSAFENLEAWDDGVKILNMLLHERDDLEGIERVEALARIGSSLIQLGKRDDAKPLLEEAAQLFRTGRVSPSSSTFYYAMAQFKIGEIIHAEMREAKLPPNEKQLQPALEHKCQLLLNAQLEYTRAIRIAHPHWAAAASFRIGNLYRNLWNDMIQAPVPKDLDEEASKIYKDILKKRIRVLLGKAVIQWERTLKMARRLNLSNEWIEQTTKELKEVRTILTLVENK